MTLKNKILINNTFGNRIKESYIKNNYTDYYNEINEFCVKYDFVYFGWKRKVYHYIFNIIEVPKCYCGNLIKFRGRPDKIYNEFCSNKCSTIHTSDNRMNTLKINNNKKYGVDNVFQLDSVKQKIKETNLDKYGHENPNNNSDIRKKIENTNLKRYGSVCALSSVLVRDKIKETNLERYGFEHHMMNDDVKMKLKETFREKYGVDNPNLSEDYRLINFDLAKDENYKKYIGDNISLFKCDIGNGHNFEIHRYLYRNRKRENNPLCTVCYPVNKNVSIKEIEFLNFIKSIYSDNIISNYRDGHELDVYLPELKLGFEFNGLYWHSNIYKEKEYHEKKTNLFLSKGISVIHIWEDDWIDKKDIIKSIVSYKLNKISNRIYARLCEVKLVELKECADFLNDNHLQGKVASMLKLGLYYNNELVSLMTFDKFEGRKKMSVNGWNLNRFCNKINHNVIGGASKLFKFFIKEYKPKRIISYADKTWSNGDLYTLLGFDEVSILKCDFKYLVKNKRVHKSRFRKSNTNISESELNIPRIYDCGKIKYEFLF